MISKPISTVLLCASLGCVAKKEPASDTSKTIDSVSTTVYSDTIRTMDPLPPAPSPDSARPPAGTGFSIPPDPYGPLRVGMTVPPAAPSPGGGFAAPEGYSGGGGDGGIV